MAQSDAFACGEVAGAGGEHLSSPDVRTGYISGDTFHNKRVTYSVVDGEAIFEGCIILGRPEDLDHPQPEAVADDEGPMVVNGVVISGSRFRWPNGRIPYEIDSALPNQARVTDAIAHWERNTRIRFIPRTPANAAQFPDFVRFTTGTGCSSSVGMRGGQQFVRLASGCSTGSTIHEIGHASGVWHEQSREDRDDHVTVNVANVTPGMEHNFDQHITDGDDVGPYDFNSIMHYPRDAFSRNGRDTIVPRGGQAIGQRSGLSPGDCQAVRWMYRNLEQEFPQPVSGVQFRATIEPNASRRWFTHSWPAHWFVHWTVVPTAPVQDQAAQVEWKHQIERQSGGLLKHYIEARNLTAQPVDIEARYDILGWSLSFT